MLRRIYNALKETFSPLESGSPLIEGAEQQWYAALRQADEAYANVNRLLAKHHQPILPRCPR